MKSQAQKEGIQKLKELVKKNSICLFCLKVSSGDGSGCSPMLALHVCENGNIWFLSDKYSHKNTEIKKRNRVQLSFSNPDRNSFFIVNGQAEISTDKQKIEDLWSPIANKWFEEGQDDPNISIIRVEAQTSYYWDTDFEKMISFLEAYHQF